MSGIHVKLSWLSHSFWLLLTDNSDKMVLIVKEVIIIEQDVLRWNAYLNSIPDPLVIPFCHLTLVVGNLLQRLQKGALLSLTVAGTNPPLNLFLKGE